MRRLHGFLFLSACTFGMIANVLVLRVHNTTEDEVGAMLSNLNASTNNTRSLLDNRTVISLRTKAQKEFAQLCTRAHRGAVYMKHHRKAGGSSLYSVFEQQVCPHTPVYSSELPFFNATHSFSSLPNSTVFITSLRHPIDRILSLYWFEGRWPRTCEWKCENNKTKDDTTKVADLNEWIEAVYHQRQLKKYKLRPHTACGQWQSVENYYTRQLLGVDRGDDNDTTHSLAFLNKTLTVNDLHRAKQILASFDLVLIQERYQIDFDMIRMFQTISGANVTAQGLPHARKGLERSASYEPPSQQELKRLHELNRLDMELYDFAKNLSRHTVEEWVEREATQYSHGENVKSLLKQCIRPPRRLPPKQSDVLLGGSGCRSPPFYYFVPRQNQPRCLFHSNIH